MRKIIFAIMLSMAITGCEDGSDGQANSNSVFTSWTTADSTVNYDFSGGEVSQAYDTQITRSTGEICACEIQVEGSQSAGSIQFNSCSYVSGGSGDPNCLVAVGNSGLSYSFTVDNDQLNLCADTNQCIDYILTR